MNSDGKLYLRSGRGKVFGPVAFETLQQWARDGRVEPTSAISDDLKNWIAAPNIPDLGMEWVVENNPGQFYGPTHRAVIDDFIKSGTLAPGARFYRDMRSGLAEKAESAAAAEAAQKKVQEELAAKDALVQQARDEQRQTAERLDKERKAREQTCAELTQARAETTETAAALAAARAAQAQLTQQLEAAQTIQKNTARDLAAAQADRESLSGERDALVKERDGLRREREELQKARAALQQELDELKHVPENPPPIVEPEVIIADEPPPKPVRDFGGAPRGAAPLGGMFGGNISSLADLERQAQAELARMRAAGGRGFFGFGKKK